MKRLSHLFIVTFSICLFFGVISSAQALDYGRLVFASAHWSDGTPLFENALTSQVETATAQTPNAYAPGSLRGYLFKYANGRYAYLGDGSGGRFINQKSTQTGATLGASIPAGTYVICFARNSAAYIPQTSMSSPELVLNTSSWYKANGIATTIEEATKFEVVAGQSTVINDAILPTQANTARTTLKGQLHRLTKYREIAECSLITESGSQTGFDSLVYASTSGIFSFSDLPAGTYTIKYAIASSRTPTRLAPLSLFSYQAPSTRHKVASGKNNSAGSFTLAKLPQKRIYPTGAANQFQRKIRAYRWLAQRVPYSQRRWHEGYRTDCSGFGSMIWGLGRSTTTYYWHYSGYWRSVNDLKYGDEVILEHLNGKPYHAVMFTRWIDKNQLLFEYIHLNGAGVAKSMTTWKMANSRCKAYYPKYHSKMASY